MGGRIFGCSKKQKGTTLRYKWRTRSFLDVPADPPVRYRPSAVDSTSAREHASRLLLGSLVTWKGARTNTPLNSRGVTNAAPSMVAIADPNRIPPLSSTSYSIPSVIIVMPPCVGQYGCCCCCCCAVTPAATVNTSCNQLGRCGTCVVTRTLIHSPGAGALRAPPTHLLLAIDRGDMLSVTHAAPRRASAWDRLIVLRSNTACGSTAFFFRPEMTMHTMRALARSTHSASTDSIHALLS